MPRDPLDHPHAVHHRWRRGPGRARRRCCAGSSSSPAAGGRARRRPHGLVLPGRGGGVLHGGVHPPRRLGRARRQPRHPRRRPRPRGGGGRRRGDRGLHHRRQPAAALPVIPGTPLGDAMHRAHDRGCVVGGTSAGASIMSDFMISMGEEGITPRQRGSQLSAGPRAAPGGRGRPALRPALPLRPAAVRRRTLAAPARHRHRRGHRDRRPGPAGLHGARRRCRLRPRLPRRAHRRRGGPGCGAPVLVSGATVHTLPAGATFDLADRRPHRLRRAAPRPARLVGRCQGLKAPDRPPAPTRGEAPMDRPTPTGPAAPDLRDRRVAGLPWRQHLVLRTGDAPRRRPRRAGGLPHRHPARLHRPPRWTLCPASRTTPAPRAFGAASSSGCARAPGSATCPSTSLSSSSRRRGTTCAGARRAWSRAAPGSTTSSTATTTRGWASPPASSRCDSSTTWSRPEDGFDFAIELERVPHAGPSARRSAPRPAPSSRRR